MKWDINDEVTNINASQLLGNNQKAKSLASENFLINTLKIKQNDDGRFNNEVDKITVLITDIKLTFAKNANNSDYEITGGNFKLQFVNKNIVEKFGENYTIPLAINHQGLINPKLSFNLDEDNFKHIPGFKYKESNEKPENNTDLYQYLNLKNPDTTYIIDSLNWLNNFINKKDLITIKVTGREINPVQKNEY